MKTILFTAMQGVEARNILRTRVFDIIQKEPNTKLVFLVPNEEKKEYYEKEILAPNVEFIVFNLYKKSRIDALLGACKIYLLRTGTMDVKRKIRLETTKSHVLYFASLILNRIFARPFWRKLYRKIDDKIIYNRVVKDFIKTINPNLIVTAHIFDDAQSSLIREGRRLKITTIGIINSWDKLTARSTVRVLPDIAIAHNEIIKKEMQEFSDMEESRIEIVGIPHFDQYFEKATCSREELFEKIGADSSKKLIMFAPIGKTFADVDDEIIEILEEIQKSGKIIEPIQFLVRFPPNDSVELSLNNKNGFILEQPGTRFSKKRGVDWDMTKDEIFHLRNELEFTDLLVTHFSTLILEAALLDKPVITIGFDGKYERPLGKGIARYYDFTHILPVVASGGTRIAKNTDELIEMINNYLRRPELDKSGRKFLTTTQVQFLDGKSSDRMASVILGAL